MSVVESAVLYDDIAVGVELHSVLRFVWDGKAAHIVLVIHTEATDALRVDRPVNIGIAIAVGEVERDFNIGNAFTVVDDDHRFVTLEDPLARLWKLTVRDQPDPFSYCIRHRSQ